MSWTAPITWAVGDTLTSADVNAHLRDNIQFNKDVFRQVLLARGGPGTTWNNGASASYSDYMGTDYMKQAGYVKKQSDTHLYVAFCVSGWATSTVGTVQMGVKVGATDFSPQLSSFNYNTLNQRMFWGGRINMFPFQVAAGTYDITLRVKTNTTGTQINAGSNDLAIMEIYERSDLVL